MSFCAKVAVKLERNKTAHLKKRFHGFWTGAYGELSRETLHLLLVEQTRFGNLLEIGSATIPLLELATGSVQQDVTFSERDEQATVESYRCNFHVHFQERFTFVLRFVNWSARGLLKMDNVKPSKSGQDPQGGANEGGADPFLKFSLKAKGSRRYAWTMSHARAQRNIHPRELQSARACSY